MKKTVKILLVALMLVVCGSCFKKADPPELPTLTSVKYVIIGSDPGSYVAFEINSALEVRRYDFTYYWISGKFDFFTDPLPEPEEYQVDQWTITQEKWDRLMAALKENEFPSLPSELKGELVTDYFSLFIQIEGPEVIHKSGGYAVDFPKAKENKRFMAVVVVLNEIIKR